MAEKCAIFKAVIAASSPLLPCFPPALSIACCSSFVAVSYTHLDVYKRQVLFDDDELLKIDVVVVVVDASNLKRNLLFCSQIIDIKKPVIVVLSMMDIAKKKGTQIDINGLSRALGFPVLAVNPRNNKGMTEFKKQLENTVNAKFQATQRDFIDN